MTSDRRPPGDLTPAQHAVIRQQLFLLPIYIWVVYAWSIFFQHLPVPPVSNTAFLFRDFVHFYAQGVITRAHDAHALYDIDAMAAVVDRFMPAPAEARFPPVYGPQVGLLFAPLTALSYASALGLWLALTIAGYGLCVYLVWRTCPTLHHRKWMTATLALGAAGLHFTLSFAQASVIGLACLTTLWLALRRGRPFLAGLAVGALAYKPQLGVVAAFVFVLGGEWRVVAGALTAVGAQVAASVIYWGPSIFVGYAGALRKLPGVIDAMEPDKALMHSWRAMLLHLGLSSSWALGVSLVLSGLTIAAAVVCWRTRGALAARYTVLVLATLLVNPHIYAYDLMLVVPALLVAWDWSNERPLPPARYAFKGATPGATRQINTGQLLTAFTYLAPLITIALPLIPMQWSVVAFVMLAGHMARTIWPNGPKFFISR